MISESAKNIFLLQGLIYFALLVSWWVAIWKSLLRRISNSPADAGWVLLSFAIGIGYGVCAAYSWGPAAAGTAFAIGFCISLALIHPIPAACLLASSLFLRPWELIPNDAYLSILPRLSFIFCSGHLCLDFAKKRRIHVIWNSSSLALVGLAIWCFLSTLAASDPAASQSEFFNGLMKSIFLYFILIHLIQTEGALRALLNTLLISFLAVGLISIFQSGSESRLQGFGAFSNSNDIAALMVLILPFSLIPGFRKGESALIRALGLVASIVALVAIFLSGSRGAMLGVAGMFVALSFIKARKHAWSLLAIGAVLLAAYSAVSLKNRSAEDLGSSSADRITYLKAGLRMGAHHPIFGVGFDGFTENLAHYSTESLEEDPHMTAHNSWVLVFAETGFLGLLFFSFAYLAGLRSAREMIQVRPEFFMAMIGYGIAMSFLSHSYLIYPYLLYGLVAIARRVPTWS